MTANLQPLHLHNQWVRLIPLRNDDFERLYVVASDPLIWEQHPNPDRYQRPVFRAFFDLAMASGGAFLILDTATGGVIGTTRFYDYDAEQQTIKIGYTFFDRKYWGTMRNRAVKTLMLDHAFQFVDKVIFDIGAENTRSQIAIGRMGAVKTSEWQDAQPDGTVVKKFAYTLTREVWQQQVARYQGTASGE